jgi:hypothetical protein
MMNHRPKDLGTEEFVIKSESDRNVGSRHGVSIFFDDKTGSVTVFEVYMLDRISVPKLESSEAKSSMYLKIVKEIVDALEGAQVVEYDASGNRIRSFVVSRTHRSREETSTPTLDVTEVAEDVDRFGVPKTTLSKNEGLTVWGSQRKKKHLKEKSNGVANDIESEDVY